MEQSFTAPAPAPAVPSTLNASGEHALTLRIPIDDLVRDNRALILDLLLRDHPAHVQAAVRALLGAD